MIIKHLPLTIGLTAAVGIASAANAQANAQTQAPSSAAKQQANSQTSQSSPNVVWILLDDVGYGAISAFGGLIETPNIDALADQGIRYTNFHTTAISSPTRAALLSGRNHHSVGMGLFPETAIDQPGYNAKIPFSKALAPDILRADGYATFAVGKWHITPVDEATPAGPFTRWPTGRGFDQFYGFLYGETDQWHPQLIDGTRRVDSPDGVHFGQLITDRAILDISNQKSVKPDQPFFLYYATGAAHAPHQVAKEWIDKYKGKFDGGWDQYREQVAANQKKLGIIASNTAVSPRDPKIPAWESLSSDEKKLYARYMEAYAGFISYTDLQIGRLVNHLKEIGQYDNTIFAVIVGDNGASKEGTDAGTQVGLFDFSSKEDAIKRGIANIDKIGSDFTSPNYPLGWAQATNTPFRKWKQDANSEGGTRNPLILSWANGISEKGQIRRQYGHVIDLLPTTLELAGVKAPATINQVKQDTLEGTSLAYTIADSTAKSRHTVQYYEINGTRGIYKDGWKASTQHIPGTSFDADQWELFNVAVDPTEQNNLAVQNPTKLAELKALFQSEGTKYHVFPLKDDLFSSFARGNNPFAVRKEVTLYGGIDQIFGAAAPNVSARPHLLNATVEISQNANGVIFANGGRFGGSSLFIKDGVLKFAYGNGVSSGVVSSSKSIPEGKVELGYRFIPDPKAGVAKIELIANGESIGSGEVPFANGFGYFAYDEGFDVGRDLQTPVSDLYKSPFTFEGRLVKIKISYL